MVVGADTMERWLRDARFPRLLGKLLARPYLAVREIARAARAGAGPLAVEEELLALGHATVTGAFGRGERRPYAAIAPVEQVKALLCARYRERLTLDELGRAVNVSPYHLARSFPAPTRHSPAAQPTPPPGRPPPRATAT